MEFAPQKKDPLVEPKDPLYLQFIKPNEVLFRCEISNTLLIRPGQSYQEIQAAPPEKQIF